MTFTVTAPDNPPALYVTNPGQNPGEAYPQGSPISITWSAYDDNLWPSGGNVVNLSYGPTPSGGTVIGSNVNVDTSYQWDTTSVPLGTYYVNASVYDSKGQKAWDSSNYSFQIVLQDLIPPTISDPTATPSPQELGGNVNISAVITDNIAVAEARVNITGPIGMLGNFSMFYDVATVRYYDNRTYSQLGQYNFVIWARDTSDNWASSTGFFNIIDTTPPTISDVTSLPSPQQVGGNVNISAFVSDNDRISSVYVNITDPAGGATNTSMAYDPVSGRFYLNNTYALAGTYTFVIWAADDSGNPAFATGSFQMKFDPFPPTISDATALPSPQIIGGFVNVSAIVQDNLEVSNVSVVIYDPMGSLLGNFSMSYDVLNGRYYFNQTYDIPGVYSFTIWANDTSDNNAFSQGSFRMRELVPPTITDATALPSPQEVGSYVNVSANVTDNYQVASVTVNITDPSGGTVGNFTMFYDVSNDRFYLNRTYSIVGIHTFSIWAKDTSDNWASFSGQFESQDTTPPIITHAPVSQASVFQTITITATIVDVTGVNTALLFYKGIQDATFSQLPMNLVAGDEYASSIPAQSIPGEVRYYIWANDSYSNNARHPATGEHTINVVDLQPPSISDATAQPTPQISGGYVNISADVTDNVKVDKVYIEVKDPSGISVGNFTATFDTLRGRYYLNGSYDVTGTYSFILSAKDTSGNWASVISQFEVLAVTKRPNAPTDLEVLAASEKVIALSWLPPTSYDDGTSLPSQEIKGFNVYRAEVKGGPYTRIAENIPVASYADDNTEPSKTYYYVVTAVSIHDRESDYSNEAVGKTERIGGPSLMDLLWWVLLIAVITVIIHLIIFAIARKRKKAEEIAEKVPPPEESAHREGEERNSNN